MSKGSKKRRDAKKNAHRMTSSLAQHQRVKKKLVPPLNKMAGIMKHTRWLDERVPELLWACLVRAVLPRAEALEVFRGIALIGREFVDGPDQLNELIPSHTNLAERHQTLIPRIVAIVVARPLGYAALRPLLILDSLPGRELWAAALALEPDPDEANTLADAIIEFFDHQSEHSTDVRWLFALFGMLTKKIILPTTLEQRAEEIFYFPNRGDLRSVRPSIRNTEQMLWMSYSDQDPQYVWSAAFWKECLERTPCILAEPEAMDKPEPPSSAVGPVIAAAMDALSEHWVKTTRTTTVDATHEGTFTFVLYAMTCLFEMLGRNRKIVAGRLLLRTIAECRITLAYLQHKDDAELWAKFRRYGTGQAKLVLLKINEAARPPHSISVETLESLANEDVWQEFVDIDLGNWAGADLRKMAEESGTKDVYDAHYGWNSGFVHGHWAAMRDATLTTCLNPVHRGHRIPAAGQRNLGDVLPDAIDLVNAMLTGLLRAYPGAMINVRVPASAQAPDDAAAPQEDKPSKAED